MKRKLEKFLMYSGLGAISQRVGLIRLDAFIEVYIALFFIKLCKFVYENDKERNY